MDAAHRRTRRLAALVIAITGLLVGAPGAAAAVWPVWSDPTDLTPPSAQAFTPDVAVSGDDEAVAVWRRATAAASVVQAASRPAEGSWSAPADLSAAGADALDPHVGISARGSAVAVWRRSTAGGSVVEAATRRAGCRWSAPTRLTPTDATAVDPQVAVSAEGDAVALWNRVSARGSVVQAATRPAGGSWSAPADLSPPEADASAGRVAVSPDGDAVAVWHSAIGGHMNVQAATRPRGGLWSEAADLSSAASDALDPHVAIGNTGEALAVWVRQVGSGSIVQSATRPAGGAWSGPADLTPSEPRVNAVLPQVGVSAGGDAIAVWVRIAHPDDGSLLQSVVQAATRATGGAWSAATTLTGAGVIASAARVAVSDSGDAVAVWQSIVPRGGGVVQVSTRAASGSWSAPTDLTPRDPGHEASRPRVAVGGGGDAIVVWQRSSATGSIVQAAEAGATATPPFLDSYATSSAAPTYTTPDVLQPSTSYRVTVTGTFSRWGPSLMAAVPEPGWVVCGAPEGRPLFPSPGIPNARAAQDAEFLFARPYHGTRCSDDPRASVPARRSDLRFSVDGGATFAAVTPDGGVPTAPDPQHRYVYTLTGRGYPLTVILIDTITRDNSGQLRVMVEPAASRFAH